MIKTFDWNILFLNGPEIKNFIHGLELWQIGLGVFFSFACIYLGLAYLSLCMTQQVLPFLKMGCKIDNRPLKPNQIATEIKLSIISIFVFSLYGVLTMWCEQSGFLKIEWTWTFNDFVVDMLLLIMWNELHFYVCHASLHQNWMYKHIHVIHHKSKIPTPFSTFSFHWGEALMLSSVMILLMPFRDLNIGVIMLFPVVSLFMNNIGHMNYAVFPSLTLEQMFSSCRRHTLHHTRIKGNYGFLVPYFDRIFKTRAKNIDYTKSFEKDI